MRLSVALFVAATVARLLVTAPGWGITLLYDIPVALIAVSRGTRAGLLAALTALALFALTDVARPIVAGDVTIHTNLAGYASRAAVYGLLGVVLGRYSDLLARSERMLSGVLDSVHEAVVTAGADGRITAFNGAAEREFGVDAADAIGQPLTMLIPERFHAAHTAGIARYVATGESRVIGRPVELVARRATGEEFPVELSLTAFEVQGEHHVTGVIRNIAERQQAEHERAVYQARLERSNTELEQFAYVASHDLQEPLRSIGGFVQLLDRRYRGRLDDDADRYIGFVVGGVERMQALIDDLLSYSRAGRVELRRRSVDTAEIVRRTLALLEAAVTDAGARVDVGELPTVDADGSTLGQVFQNLVGNAVKFSNGHVPHVAISAEREDAGWRFAVADNGIGIDPAHEERIFRMFQRLHTREEYGGTGIGLAITKRIVDRHGGRIWCEPRPEGGTVFCFTIPDEPALLEDLP